MENKRIKYVKGKMMLQVENLLPYHFVHHIINMDRHRLINNCNKIINKQISTSYLYNTSFNIIQICHLLSSKCPFPPNKITSVFSFISVFNQLDAQNLFHNKFYFMPLHVSSTCAHHQDVKIVLHSLWYHHTYR